MGGVAGAAVSLLLLGLEGGMFSFTGHDQEHFEGSSDHSLPTGKGVWLYKLNLHVPTQ